MDFFPAVSLCGCCIPIHRHCLHAEKNAGNREIKGRKKAMYVETREIENDELIHDCRTANINGESNGMHSKMQ